VRTFLNIKWLFLATLLGCLSVVHGLEWGNELGSSSYKVMKVAPTARQTALAGSGLANPGSATESAWNPMAAAWANSPQISINQVRLSDRLGANWNTLQVVQPLGSVRVSAGVNFLDVKDFAERDDLTGATTGSFGAFVWSERLALASGPGAFTWGLQGSFSHFNISNYDSRAVLADAVMGYGLSKSWRLAAGLFHFGWVESFDAKQDLAPTTLQAGISYHLNFPESLDWNVHTDLRRSNDGLREYMLGIESTYRKFLTLRMGSQVTSQTETTINGGIGLLLGSVEASYAYAAHKSLKGSHSFGLAYGF
jgi:hypothetical protein